MAHFTKSTAESNRIDNGSKDVAKEGSKIHSMSQFILYKQIPTNPRQRNADVSL
jgi:hypothetical protein